MLKRRSSDSHRIAAWLLLLAIAFVLGVLAGPAVQRLAPGKSSTKAPPPPPPPSNAAEQAQALPLLQLSITDEHWQRIVAQREQAMANGMIVQDERAIVPVSARLGDEVATGQVRLKGDWLDHVNTDQWSLRLELESPLGGMRRFSIQHPKTRGYFMEWLVMKTARYMDVLSPRASFVRASINGSEPLTYYLEEHASKELLESQGRRAGPIIKFDEGPLWGTWLQYGFHRTGTLPDSVTRATTLFDTEAKAFRESALRKLQPLNTRLMRALQQARDLQRLALADTDEVSRSDGALRRLQALHNLEGRTIEAVFDVEKLGRWLALLALFGSEHALMWHQWRFYHDPVHDRLEPMAFDTGAALPIPDIATFLAADELGMFHRSPQVMAAAYRSLGHMVEPGWIEGLLDEILREPAMREAARSLAGVDLEQLVNVVMRQQIEKLRAMIRPQFAIGFDARVIETGVDGGSRPFLEVQAWARTDVPTQVTAFRLGNGRVVRAASAFAGLLGSTEPLTPPDALPDGGVLLPLDGRRMQFLFPADERLVGLREIETIKRAIRDMVEPGKSDALTLSADYRTAGEHQDRTHPLLLRHSHEANDPITGRPIAPSLPQTLQRHPWLRYDLAENQLSVPAGTHVVTEDLHLPDHRALHLDAGAQLQLAPEVTVVVGALHATGSQEQPIQIGPTDTSRGFEGLLVLGTAGASHLQHTEFSGGTAIARNSWQTTSGITFCRSPVTLHDCSFRDARGEDSLNLIGVRIDVQRCVFDAGPSDLLDGDFVSGTIAACHFANSGEDAIDVSGAVVTVLDCTFASIGDKALSIGESSQMTARGCHVERAAIAVASKDKSAATIENLTVDAVEHFVAAAYIKKPEFGSTHLTLKGLQWNGTGEPQFLAQTGCSIEVDGVAVPPKDIDVAELYKQKVLGK